ncbi:Hint domain-containing protein [Pseudooceanicola sp. MF1-13]|uniref:Hint domain-containing protein n=1 Tax=Pseudooceanicola sp. MF1-13 TaxID=3379095 RepID=UPI0038916514
MADGKYDGTSGGNTIVPLSVDADGDQVDGGDGLNDLIYGYGGNDTIAAGQGNDTIYGGSGADSIEGRSGDDVLYGGTGQDTLEGDFGNDTIYIGSGDDDIYGGRGNDLIYVVQGTSAYVEGQSGDDTLDFSTLTGTTIVQINPSGGSGNGQIVFANGEVMEYRGIENIVGTQDGTVGGNPWSDYMSDGFTDGQWDEIGNGDGSHNDQIMAYGGNDTVLAGQGNDTIYGGAGNDSLNGNSGDDAIHGDSGDDALYGGDGSDTLFSGAGNDSYYGGTGIDYIDFSGESGAISVNFSTGSIGGAAAGDFMGSGMDGAYGTAFDDTIIGFDTYSATGDAYTNVFFGGAGNDWMDGRGSPDYMVGGSGDDTFNMSGTPGSDTVIGGEGGSDNDLLDFSSLAGPLNVTYSGAEAGTIVLGADTITFSEIETIYATSGADTVTGGAGGDTIYGREGGDQISTNGGADEVFGGQGSDTIYGGAGVDTLTGDTGDDFLYGGAGGDTLSGGLGNDSMFGGSGDDTMLGGQGADTLNGDAGGDSLLAGSGDDRVFGGAGSDTVAAGAGADSVEGGSGDDVLNGGAGADTIYGGQGNDSITTTSGDDTIYGQSGDDFVTLLGSNNYALYGGEDPGDTDWDILDVSTLADGGQITVINYDPGTDQSGTIHFTNGDVATFSGFERVICLARGTRVATDQGYRRVENLRQGNLLVTKDHGPQPLRWIGHRDVDAVGPAAPVVFAPGTVGNDRELRVSPQHRMLVTGWKPEMLFGEPEVLVAAKHMIDGGDITQDHGGEVEYFHLCLDRHEIIYAEGAETESFLAGEVGLSTLTTLQREDLAEALAHLPQPFSAKPARPMLRAFEAQLLMDPAAVPFRPVQPGAHPSL